LLGRFRRFLDEAWSELKKVTWPTPVQTRNLTILVVVVSAAVGVYISFFDLLFTEIIRVLTV
jgi:preprotein translocase SecE subunit